MCGTDCSVPHTFFIHLSTNHEPVVQLKGVAVRRTLGDHRIIAVGHETGDEAHDVLLHFRSIMLYVVNVMIMVSKTFWFIFYPCIISQPALYAADIVSKGQISSPTRSFQK